MYGFSKLFGNWETKKWVQKRSRRKSSVYFLFGSTFVAEKTNHFCSASVDSFHFRNQKLSLLQLNYREYVNFGTGPKDVNLMFGGAFPRKIQIFYKKILIKFLKKLDFLKVCMKEKVEFFYENLNQFSLRRRIRLVSSYKSLKHDKYEGSL